MRLAASLPTSRPPPRPTGFRPALAKVVAPTADLGRYDAKLIAGTVDPDATGDLELADLGGAATTSNCQLWCLADIQAGHATLSADDLVIGFAGPLLPEDEQVIVVTEGRVRPAIIACRIERTSGAAGDQDTQCAYVYTARTADWDGFAFAAGGRVLGTGLTPIKPRPSVGAMICQSGSTGWGIGTWDGGTFVLLDALEQVDQEACGA